MWALNTLVVFIVFHGIWGVLWKNGYTVFHCRQHIQHGTKLTDKNLDTWPLFHKELLSFSFVNLVNIFCPISREISFPFISFFISVCTSSQLPSSGGHKVSGIVWAAQFPFKNDTTSALSKLSYSPKPTVLKWNINYY